ncbi:MAG: hypothetical protein VKN60_05985 [Cyanobacteriota bacterium]|nr:hypothetical protein [Cyanobacteriota bacterium]
MNTTALKKRLIEKINDLSEEQLNMVTSFVEGLQNPLKDAKEIQCLQSDEDRKALAEKFKQLCAETQALFTEHPITEQEIQAEIDAYRRGE